MNNFNQDKSIHVAWLTNLPAPYRIPIWDHLAKSVRLHVFFLHGEKNWRGWSVTGSHTWLWTYFSKFSIKIREFDLIPDGFGAKKVTSGADIVIIGGWESPFYLATALRARKAKIPIVMFYESTLESRRFNGRFVRYFRSRIFLMADHVVTVGVASTEATLDIGVNPEKILTLFNPVDVKLFAEFSSHQRTESSSGHRFLYVGRLISLKNVDSLVSAFASIRATNDSLTIVGDGALLGGLKDRVANLELESLIHFTGYHNQIQVAQDYANADTLVLPSTNEVWGLVVNEALASGIHVVVSNAAGVSRFVEPMKGAYICEPTSAAIALALVKSRSEWQGPIANPKIMEYTAERFADAIFTLISKY